MQFDKSTKLGDIIRTYTQHAEFETYKDETKMTALYIYTQRIDPSGSPASIHYRTVERGLSERPGVNYFFRSDFS